MSHPPTEMERPKEAPRPAAAPAPAAPARPRRTRTVLWTVIGIIVIALAAVAYVSHKRGKTPGARGMGRGGFGPGGFMMGPLPVVARTAQKANINVILNGLGTVTPLATVTVRTQINGQIVQINFTEGQEVKQGDLLAVIDPRPYQVALEQAEGQLAQAQALLKEAQIDLDRYQTLAKQDSISKQQVDAQSALVLQYEGQTKTNQGAVDSATLNLAYCHITAPVDGRVGLRQVDLGNYVTPGDANGLVILTEVKPITVVYTLPEDNVQEVESRFHAGQALKVDVYDRTVTKKLATGAVTNLDNMIDTTTGTFKLRATFANTDEALFPNQFVNVQMLLKVDQGVTVIPTSAVERGQQGNYVYVVGPDNTVTAKTVTLGDSEGERVAVVSGVSVGASSFTEGAEGIKEGMEVVVQTPSGAPGADAHPRGNGQHRHWHQGTDN